MDLKPNAFGRRSLLWAVAALLLIVIGYCLLSVITLMVVPILTAAAFAVGGLHGVVGLWWDDARAFSVAGLILNLAGLSAVVWFCLRLWTSGWG